MNYQEVGGGRAVSPLAGVLAVAPGNHCFPRVVSTSRLAPPLSPRSQNVKLCPGGKNCTCSLSGGTSGRRRPRPPEGEVSPPNAPSLVRIRWRHVRRSPPSAPATWAASASTPSTLEAGRVEKGPGRGVGRLCASWPPKRRRCRTSGTGSGASRPSRAIGSPPPSRCP